MVVSDECQRYPASSSNSMGMNSMSSNDVEPMVIYARIGENFNHATGNSGGNAGGSLHTGQSNHKFKKNLGVV